MLRKIGTLLDEDLFKKAKQRALSEHTSLHGIFEKALSEYLLRHARSKQRFSGVEMSFGVMKLPSRSVKKLAQEDMYETE